jgi:dGTPase
MKYPVLLEDVVHPESDHELGKIPPKASVFRCDQEAFAWAAAAFTQEETAFWRNEQTLHQTFECTMIELADDIAYGTHDVEDAINLGLISIAQLQECILPFRYHELYPEMRIAYQQLAQLSPTTDQLKYRLKKIFSAMISTLITHIEIEERKERVYSPRLKYRAFLPPDLERLLHLVKELVFTEVINSQRVQTVAWKGMHVVSRLFDALMNESKLLPDHDRLQMQRAQSEEARARVVCDYIAGMTDAFAHKMYARLHGWSRNFFDD